MNRAHVGLTLAFVLTTAGDLSCSEPSRRATTDEPRPAPEAERAPAYPPASLELRIESDGVPVNALLYLAQGAGPHPTVVFLHGYPGNERNLDVAQAVRRAGYNALYFNYRGSWGSGGTFSWTNALEDARAAVAFMRSRTARESYRADTARVHVFGHSFGAWIALMATAADVRLACPAVLGTWNAGRTGRLVADGAVDSEHVSWLAEALNPRSGPLVGNADSLLSSLVRNARAYDLLGLAPSMSGKSILFVSSSEDEKYPDNDTAELEAAYRAAGAFVERHVLEDDHPLSFNRLWLADTVVGWLGRKCVE